MAQGSLPRVGDLTRLNSPLSAAERREAIRAALWSPSQLAPIVVIVAYWFGQKADWLADVSLWVLAGCIIASQLTSTLSYALMPLPTRAWQVWFRCLVMMGAVLLSISPTGWGPTLALGYIFGAVECLRSMGARATKPAMVSAVIAMLIGQVVIAVDIAPTLISEPKVHGLAFMSILGTSMVILVVGYAYGKRETVEATLRGSEERFRAMVQHAADMIMLIASDGTISYASPSMERLLGIKADDLTTFQADWLHPDDAEAATALWSTVLENPGSSQRCESRVRHVDGSWRWFDIHLTNQLEKPEICGIVSNWHEISERKRFEAELTRQAYHDSLTTLPNRTSFLEQLDAALQRCRREGAMLAVLFLDLDRFKLVNDSLGHDVGDRLLIDVTDRLRHSVRPADVVARFGGDEFTVLLQDLDGAEDAIAIAERISESLQRPIPVEGRELVLSTSIGIAVSVDGQDVPGDLLRQADLAMYLAKERGRARWELFDASSAPHVAERLELEGDLWRALDQQELVVHYQPEFDLRTGYIVGAEALVRWEHPRRGLLQPGAFVPFAEESSLILSIDRYVMRAAFHQARRWADQQVPEHNGGETVIVSVNLSPRFVRQPDLLEEINDAIAESGVDPRWVRFEITERTALTDLERTVETLEGLRRLGIRVAIDDFGTGYSSLGYLKRLPVDVVKLDRTFVESMDTSDTDLAIVQAVITMGHALGMEVTAEGVERTEQAERLAALRCDTAMGWLWSPAVAADDLADLLRTGVVPAGV